MGEFFDFNKYVTGKNFIGRSFDVATLCNLLAQNHNAVIYEAPKSGKTSLICQAFFNMNLIQTKFTSVSLSLQNIRSNSEFLVSLGSTLLNSICSNETAFHEEIEKYLGGTHFRFDPETVSSQGYALRLNGEPDENDFRSIILLPYRIGYDIGEKVYVILDEFQNIMQTEDGDWACLNFEDALKGIKEAARTHAGYIFCGSCINAMKDIFEHKKFFFRQAERCQLHPINSKDIIEHIIKGFMPVGKVIERDAAKNICDLFNNSIWHINIFCSFCNSLSYGYVNESVMNDALNSMISLFEGKYKAIMNDLTTFQISLLNAIIDGKSKFSSNEIIRQYNLNSAANVKRLKDALCKKEIATFNSSDEASIIDPLFEYWVSRFYFNKKVHSL